MPAHIQQFLKTWNANHWVGDMDEELCKIVEVGLSLHNQTNNWYSQQELCGLPIFDELCEAFKKLFHLEPSETWGIQEILVPRTTRNGDPIAICHLLTIREAVDAHCPS